MSKKLTFQEIILTLQQYWNDQGCMLMQAYDNEKGAGTMSPYTFLRAIGPEPWNKCSFPGLNKCLNLPCALKKSSIGSFVFGS